MSSPFDDHPVDPFAAAGPGPTRLHLDSADYELRWPRALLARELTALRKGPREQIERLLKEAFLGETPLQDYRGSASGFGWSVSPSLRFDFISELLAAVPRLREHRAPSPYWSARHGTAGVPPRRSTAQLRTGFAQLVVALQADGYFARAFPTVCVDDRDGIDIDPSAVLAERLGVPDLWPLTPKAWDEATFYDLIEVLHDLAARPRTRSWHSWDQCGWHFANYATDIGRAVYRWRINELLATGEITLRLAEDGEDIGRLVHVVDDARTDLLERALASAEPGVRGRVEHAIALFRGRDATEHHKRSASITLAGILEERRTLIRDDLGRKDEGALFALANEFAIRHQRRGQQGDYDPAFLDWIFWWYLATVELTDRIIARQASAATPSTP